MGSINTKIIILSATLGPGQTATWYWNNPLHNAVYAFSVVPHSYFSTPNTWLRAELSTLKYSRNTGTGKRRIEYQVKNLTQSNMSYEVHMSWATPI